MKATTSRTLKLLRDMGYTCGVVEMPFNPHFGGRRDLFGFADILAYNRDCAYLVQSTSKSNMSSRRKKMRGPAYDEWMESLHRGVLLIGWKKVKGRWRWVQEWKRGADGGDTHLDNTKTRTRRP